MTRGRKPPSGGMTRIEIGNLLEGFKTNILGTLTTHLDVLHTIQRQAEVE